jgi:hypothetical protein
MRRLSDFVAAPRSAPAVLRGGDEEADAVAAFAITVLEAPARHAAAGE